MCKHCAGFESYRYEYVVPLPWRTQCSQDIKNHDNVIRIIKVLKEQGGGKPQNNSSGFMKVEALKLSLKK